MCAALKKKKKEEKKKRNDPSQKEKRILGVPVMALSGNEPD